MLDEGIEEAKRLDLMAYGSELEDDAMEKFKTVKDKVEKKKEKASQRKK